MTYRVHTGYVNPAHTAGIASTHEVEQQKKTTQQLNNVESLLKAYPERNIEKFFNPGGLEQGVHALAAAKHVMLSTGFNVAEGQPETDGPPGLAALANALIQTGKTVTFVTDSTNKPLVKACLDVLNPNAAKYCKFETFDVKPEAVANAADNAAKLLALREAEIKAEKKANRLLDTHKPDVVFTLELAGRGNSGISKNMRGVDITGFNSMVDEVLNQANNRKITTVCVGDGGNEAGMGGLKGIPHALDGTEMQARTQAGIQVTSWNSNLGGEALAAGVLAKHGMLKDKRDEYGNIIEKSKLHTPDQQKAMIQAVLDGGGVDGVTRGKVLNAESEDTLGRPVQTGVDGFHTDVHGGVLRMLKNITSTIPPDDGMIAKAAVKDKPFQIAAFDSGAGGLVAAKNLAGFLKHRSNHNARFIAISDFGNSPYGAKTRDELVHLVGTGLKTAETVGVDVIVMACNTACTSFPESQAGIGVPVLDLIQVTAEAIAEHGGPKPVVLSTEATAKDDMYQKKIKEAVVAKGKAAGKTESEIALPNVVRLGAGDKADINEDGKDWATHINNVLHLSKETKDQAELTRVVNKYVDQIPADATSVWLCCTHYPAWKELIEKRLQELGRGHIQVIDPMEYQADALIKLLDQQDEAEKSKGKEKAKAKAKTLDQPTNRINRTDDTKPLVITSGKLAEATKAANSLLQSKEGARILSAELTGEKFNMELLAPHMYYDLKSPSNTSFNSSHKLWEIPGPGKKDKEPKLLGERSSTPSDKPSDEDLDKKSRESLKAVRTPIVLTPTLGPQIVVSEVPSNVLEPTPPIDPNKARQDAEAAELALAAARKEYANLAAGANRKVEPSSVSDLTPTNIDLKRKKIERSTIVTSSKADIKVSSSAEIEKSESIKPSSFTPSRWDIPTESPPEKSTLDLTPEKLTPSTFTLEKSDLKKTTFKGSSFIPTSDTVHVTPPITDLRFKATFTPEATDGAKNTDKTDTKSIATAGSSSSRLESRIESLGKAVGHKLTGGAKFKRHQNFVDVVKNPPEKKGDKTEKEDKDKTGGGSGAPTGAL